MGPGKRFEIHFTRALLFGIHYDDFRYDHDFTIHIGFIVISIGLGKPYTER